MVSHNLEVAECTVSYKLTVDLVFYWEFQLAMVPSRLRKR